MVCTARRHAGLQLHHGQLYGIDIGAVRRQASRSFRAGNAVGAKQRCIPRVCDQRRPAQFQATNFLKNARCLDAVCVPRGFVYGPGDVPLEATISVEGIHKDYTTRPKFGDFYRPLIPGSHNVTIQYPPRNIPTS